MSAARQITDEAGKVWVLFTDAQGRERRIPKRAPLAKAEPPPAKSEPAKAEPAAEPEKKAEPAELPPPAGVVAVVVVVSLAALAGAAYVGGRALGLWGQDNRRGAQLRVIDGGA